MLGLDAGDEAIMLAPFIVTESGAGWGIINDYQKNNTIAAINADASINPATVQFNLPNPGSTNGNKNGKDGKDTKDTKKTKPPKAPCYALRLVDPKTSETFDPVRPDGVKIGVPGYLDVASISNAALARPGSMSTFPGVNFRNFYKQNVDPYYDPKKTGGDSAYQHIGNFIYGYTGASYGISYDMLERQAGLRQAGADPTQQPTGFEGLTGGVPPFYGDDPVDGMVTALGMGVFERGLKMEKVEVPCRDVGVGQK